MEKEIKWTVTTDDGDVFEVEDSWLDDIPRKGISKLESLSNGKKLIVTYRQESPYQSIVAYQNIFGTWAFPTKLN